MSRKQPPSDKAEEHHGGRTVLDPGAIRRHLDDEGSDAAADRPSAPDEPVGAVDVERVEGARIEQYELIRELGRGGMGQVFLARDTRLGRKVAMKFVTGDSHKFTERFLVEARATAQCSHENIVVIHEVNEHQGQPYMVLEYLEGEPLGELMRGRKLPAGRAVELMVPVVRALARAHEFGIVHRDLKPDNIFVSRSGVIKVLDFGIAKLFSDGEGALPDADQRERMARADLGEVGEAALTREGAILGTLPYMAPEQWGLDAVDHRTDLWAVGIIFYEMVAGKHPLAPASPQELMANAMQLDQPMPSVTQDVSDLPGALEQIIDRCLRKRKVDRFSSAEQLIDELELLLPGRFGRKLGEGECPYPGLTAFQESDADRFFGRAREVEQLQTRLREHALIGVVGPSGVGKSSLVRAGLVPAIKSMGQPLELFITRPGRAPLASLASLLHSLTKTSSTELSAQRSCTRWCRTPTSARHLPPVWQASRTTPAARCG
jgi:serine/threonine protein kinase